MINYQVQTNHQRVPAALQYHWDEVLETDDNERWPTSAHEKCHFYISTKSNKISTKFVIKCEDLSSESQKNKVQR